MNLTDDTILNVMLHLEYEDLISFRNICVQTVKLANKPYALVKLLWRDTEPLISVLFPGNFWKYLQLYNTLNHLTPHSHLFFKKSDFGKLSVRHETSSEVICPTWIADLRAKIRLENIDRFETAERRGKYILESYLLSRIRVLKTRAKSYLLIYIRFQLMILESTDNQLADELISAFQAVVETSSYSDSEIVILSLIDDIKVLKNAKVIGYIQTKFHYIKTSIKHFISRISEIGLTQGVKILALHNQIDPKDFLEHFCWCCQEVSDHQFVAFHFRTGAFVENRIDVLNFIESLGLNCWLKQFDQLMKAFSSGNFVFTLDHLKYLKRRLPGMLAGGLSSTLFSTNVKLLQDVICKHGDAGAIKEYYLMMKNDHRIISQVMLRYRFKIMDELKGLDINLGNLLTDLISVGLIGPVQFFLQLYPQYVTSQRLCQKTLETITRRGNINIAKYFCDHPLRSKINWSFLATLQSNELNSEVIKFFQQMSRDEDDIEQWLQETCNVS
ncbi:Hypothetical protein POVR1_LOCUS297 [uncultured virus]|nr:Hypothetical protein POVR1_LOCUS297 [uncultured virus]